MKRVTGFLVCLGLCARAAAGDAEREPRLDYIVELLGNAAAVAVVSPGAAGTGHAFACTYRPGSWSRFNWPPIEPPERTDAVTFQVRTLHPATSMIRVRLLTGDGIEWQSPAVEIGPEWQAVTLGIADFEAFRGAAAGETPALRADDVVQFQVVPHTREDQEDGHLEIDEIRLLPQGPGWAAEGTELRPWRSPESLARERLDDLLRRWQAEERRLRAAAEQALRWLDHLRDLRRDWPEPAAAERHRQALAGRQCPWQEPPPRLPPLGDCPGLDTAAYEAFLAEQPRQPRSLLPIVPGMTLAVSRLYGALPQQDPEVVHAGGEPLIRHNILFSPDAGRQTVFTMVTLPETLSLKGERLAGRLRCTAAALHPEDPLLLRLHTEGPGDGESWADFRPSVLPGERWSEVEFDLANPFRSVRFEPARVRALAFRFENSVGQEDRFAFEIAALRRLPPEPVSRARRVFLDREMEAVRRARDTLLDLRSRIAQEEDALAAQPELRRSYLASFVRPPPPTAAAAPAAPPGALFPEGTFPARDRRPDAIRIRALGRPDGWAIAADAPGETAARELSVEIRDLSGRLLASGRGAAVPGLILPLPGAVPWEPRAPSLLEACAMVTDGAAVTASCRRRIGLRTVAVLPAAANPMLRHTRHRRQPDWTFLLNGQPWFPRMTRYHWPDAERTVTSGVRMLGDLWVDGFRDYGFALRETAWRQNSSHGMALFASLAPSCRNLRGWDDVDTWRMGYVQRCRQSRAAVDAPHVITAQVGNEVELAVWGADLAGAFPDALYQPLDIAAEALRQTLEPTLPVAYVRAGSFRAVPPLPHEHVTGINQYTGRYSGRTDEIDRNLAELAREALWADRPLAITEWMGPKYSWASTGVGGVSPRGAAYYLERYWRAMINTPGIVGSSEFTLNWVIAPFEDLTNQSREEAWRNRPRHSAFGGGSSADHVPLVGPEDAVRGPCFRAMQAFHGPLYLIVNSPAGCRVSGEGAAYIAEPLRLLRPDIEVRETFSEEKTPSPVHRLALHPVTAPAPGNPDPAEPILRTRLDPEAPDTLLVTLDAHDAEARLRGIQRLRQAAEALAELNALEGAMTRTLALTDRGRVDSYENYLLEYAARGYLWGGDDTRTHLDAAEFCTDQGERRVAWRDLSGLILDTERPLEPAELQLVERLAREGAHVVVSAPCFEANPPLGKIFPATLAPAGTLARTVTPAAPLRAPLPIHNVGGADIEVIRRFRPDLADSPALALHAVDAPGAEILATTDSGQPVIARRALGRGSVTLVGVAIGAAIDVHRKVTRSGVSHRLYDRDTACGLERLSRAIVNLCRQGCPDARHRPRLFLEITPDATAVKSGQAVRATVRLTNVHGTAVAGELRCRTRLVRDGRGGQTSPYQTLEAADDGSYRIECAPGAPPTAGACPGYEEPGRDDRCCLVSLQCKAFAEGYIPADGALAVALLPGNSR
ncbi:MAG: hypothetical protein JXR77_00615 [Lentisphaeria bacterium]|nr:hypothetical protein [Lentisphaeria bacterium]